MMNVFPEQLDIEQASRLLAAGTLTSAALVDACLSRIEREQGRLNAFIRVMADEARRDARSADEEMSRGERRGPLQGIPVSIKDLIDIEGMATTAASRVREGHVAAADAPLVANLRRAGAIIVGKCNLHEFAFGTTNEDSAYGPARHPRDPARSPGGSSGGSAAAVAAGLCLASVGTDTGGSIRIPAAACGIVGLKPAYGDLPCDGVVPLSFSLDHVGPLTRSVADARLMYGAMGGTETPRGKRRLAGMRLGRLTGYFAEKLDDEVEASVERAIEQLQRAGAVIDEAQLPSAGEIAAIYLHIVFGEAAAFHARTLEERPGHYTAPVRARLEMARYVLAEDYVRAQRGRMVLRAEVEAALTGRDALVLPTLPIPAPTLGASDVDIGGKPELVRALMLRMTQPFSLTGHPAISLPIQPTRADLPVGLQLVGPLRHTAALLDIAEACEAVVRPGGSGSQPR